MPQSNFRKARHRDTVCSTIPKTPALCSKIGPAPQAGDSDNEAKKYGGNITQRSLVTGKCLNNSRKGNSIHDFKVLHRWEKLRLPQTNRSAEFKLLFRAK
jgi:hypothetical protein